MFAVAHEAVIRQIKLPVGGRIEILTAGCRIVT